MKKASIQLKYDEEKLSALEKYMIKKEVDLEVELLHTLQKLYEKYTIKGIKKGNFISYVYRATSIFDDKDGKNENIKRDIKNHMKKIRKKLNKIK